MTASSDQTCFLWDCNAITKHYRLKHSSNEVRYGQKARPSVARNLLENKTTKDSYSVTCADWSKDGKILAIGTYIQDRI